MDQSSGSSFNFVNLTHPDQLKDEEIQHRIRRLAMTEVAKGRRKPKTQRGRTEVVLNLHASRADQYLPSGFDRLGGGDVDPFARYPIDLDAASRALVAHIFRHNSTHSTLLRGSWWPVALYDAAIFYNVLSNSQLYSRLQFEDSAAPRDDELSLSYHMKSLRLVNKKLDDPVQQTSNEIMGAVGSLMCHDYIIGDFEGWAKHGNALMKMIDMRGGIDSITQQELRITLSWCDLCGASSQDIPPKISMPRQWQADARSPPRSPRPHSHISLLWKQHFPMQQNWISIFDDVSQLISLDRAFAETQLEAAVTSGSWMEPTVFRLLSIRPLQQGNNREHIIEEVCRLGMLLFLAPIWRFMGSSPVWTFSFTRNLLSTLNTHMVQWDELKPLILWAVYLAAIETTDPVEWNSFIYLLAVLMRGSQFTDWEELLRVVKGVLWVEKVFANSDDSIREEVMGIITGHATEALLEV